MAQARAGAACSAAHAAEMEAARFLPPPVHDFERLAALKSAKVRLSEARHADLNFLTTALTAREWRPREVADALQSVPGLLSGVFNSKACEHLRVKYAKELVKKVHDEHWTAENAVSLMIEGGFTHHQMDLMREAFSLRYEADTNRHYHYIFHNEGPHFVRQLEPIPSRYKWAGSFTHAKSQLRIEMNSDGSIAARKLLEVTPEMLRDHRERGMMLPHIGLTPECPVELAVMFDAFPVDAISIGHHCLANASLRDELSDQSEQLLRILCAARRPENNPKLNEVTTHYGLAAGANTILKTKQVQLYEGGLSLFAELYVTADKKGVEAHRGCCQSCPWCTCGNLLRLKLPWSPEQAPTTWSEAAAQLDKVCKHPFPSIVLIYEAAHLPLPGEALPRRCRFCKKMPFESVAEMKAAVDEWEAARADPTSEGKREFAARRLKFAHSHMNQYPYEAPKLLAGMDRVMPELMHVGDLNIGKQIDKQGIMRHCDTALREKLSTFYAGMGVRRDTKKKPDGTIKETWFKASDFAGMVFGNLRFPGGVAAWLPSVVLLVGAHKLRARGGAASKSDDDGSIAFTFGMLNNHDSAAAVHRPAFAAALTLEQIMTKLYGPSLATDLLRILIAYDKYKLWRLTIDLPTPDEASKQAVALENVVRAAELMHVFDQLADSNGKTKMFHVITYILPRKIAQHGNLWRFSTAKLEARGKRCKKMVRHNTSAHGRIASKAKAKVQTINKRGGSARQKRKGIAAGGVTKYRQAYNSSQMEQLVARMSLFEQAALNKNTARASQLASLGKLKGEHRVKGETSGIPLEVAAYVPAHLSYTCVAVFESILRGGMQPLYSPTGVFVGANASSES